jgi:hypothetical protein
LNYELTKYTSDDLKNEVKEKPFSHFVVDDFLDKNLFVKLDRDYRNFYDKNCISLSKIHDGTTGKIALKQNASYNGENYTHQWHECHKMFHNNTPLSIWGGHSMGIDSSFRIMGANVHHNNRTFGCTVDYGGSGKMIDSFQSLCNFSSTWKSFLEIIYSEEFFGYMFNIFDGTSEYKNRVGNKEIKKCYDNKIEDDKKLNYFTGTKINRYMDNYGWFLHPDTSNKVLSFLLYMDNPDWPKGIKGNGTQLWEFGDKDTDFDVNEEFKYNDNSIDFQLRDARTKEAGKLTSEQKKKIKIYKDIDFKPNRLIGFIKSDKSWHSILPMELPELVTRNCFQINIWECDKDE